MRSDHHSSQSPNEQSIRKRIFDLLDENPLFLPKQLCTDLQLPYSYYRDYVTHLRSQWKYGSVRQQGSKCSDVHAWRGWTYLTKGVLDLKSESVRKLAVERGWATTRARNKWLLWKDRLGRIQWFETGRLSLYVRKPANMGRAYQLVCNALTHNGLITDMKVLEVVLEGIRFKSAHYVFPTHERLPSLTIDRFRESNGIVIKMGDRSHPHSIEFIVSYPNWAERNERLLEELLERIQNDNLSPNRNAKRPERIRYIS